MLSFFKKRAPAYPTESKWSILRGEHEGRPMLVRRNDSAKQLAKHLEYAHRVGVAVPLGQPDEQGQPSKKDMDALRDIEDALCQHLQLDQASLLVLVITTEVMREFVFYTRAPQLTEPVLQSLQGRFSSYELQSYVQEDRAWDLYKEFT